MDGILFKPEMKQATVANIKTQTRRLDGLKEINKVPDDWELSTIGTIKSANQAIYHFHNKSKGKAIFIKPRYHLGEILYIKEVFYAYGWWRSVNNTDNGLEYKTAFFRDYGKPIYFNDTKPSDLDISRGLIGVGWFKRSPLFLEANDARYHIQITDITPQRLQDITEKDALAEGIIRNGTLYTYGKSWYMTAKAAYFALWDSINPNFPTSINPHVWKYGFKLLPENK